MTSTTTQITFVDWLTTKPSERLLRLFSCACARHPKVWPLLTDEWSWAAVVMAESFADEMVDESHLKIAYRNCPEEYDYPWHGIDIADIATRPQVGDNAWGDLEEWLQVVTSFPESTILACIAGPCVRKCDMPPGIHLPGNNCSRCSGTGFVQTPLPMLCGKCDDCGDVGWICTECRHILAWNESTIPRLARTIYEERQWGLMPVLADALEDAGCDNQAMLAHCRNDGGECPENYGKGHHSSIGHLTGPNWSCKMCEGSERLPAYHARGCWVVDLILGKR